jgi:GNAT superfamily N-acetyltransferase
MGRRLGRVRITNLGFRTDLTLRVLEGAQVTDRGDHLVIASPDNPTFWWGNFLLLAAPPGPGTAAAWLAIFAAEFPAAEHVALGVDGSGDDMGVPDDFLAASLEPQRESVLTCAAVHPPPHPSESAVIRPLASAADWQQSVDLAIRSVEAGGAGGEQEYLIRRTAARRRITEAGTGAWFGAFVDGRLLAQLGIFGVGDGLARYQHVETDPAARRQGLAGTLVWRAGRYAREVLGARTLVIVADPAGGAIGVYRACGFTAAQGQLSFERPPEA